MLAIQRSKRHSKEYFVDSLIASIWGLYLATISFVALYIYVGASTYQHHLTEGKLVALDQLLALRTLTSSSYSVPARIARTDDLPHFFLDALFEQFHEIDSDTKTLEKTERSPSKFNNTPINATQVILDVPMRMAVNGTCDALVTQLLPGGTFHFLTILVVGGAYTVKSERTKLVNFSGCQPGPDSNFQALIFVLDDGQYAFAIPRSLDEAFLGTKEERIFTNYPLRNAEQIIGLLPDALKPYANLKDDDFVIVHKKAIEYLILNFANYQLRRHLTPDRLDDAVQQIYEQKEKDASYFGINASGTQFIRIGPLIYFFLSFELWRRVRRLPAGRLTSTKYWFAFETTDLIGRSYAYLCAIAPIIFGFFIYAIFAISQGLGLVILGRMVTLYGLVTFSFPVAPAPGWTSFDPRAFILLLFTPVQFAILIVTSMKLTKVVTANLRLRRT